MESLRTAPELIGEAPAFLDALSHASIAAELNRPLLISGERGSGKELLAARIHFLSPRWEGPFVKVNCAALTDELLDSELFGHEAGSFTGASKKHRGRFERAEKGTLFLDEIASASPSVQEKLLRIIEYGEYERVGGEETLLADVRVVAAANIDLPAKAARGEFRADLLDRLAFDVIIAPPMRARKQDIPLLAAHFASALAHETDETYDGFSPEAMAVLIGHDWPGNVRELKNTAERSFYRWRANGAAGPVGEIILDPFASAHRPPSDMQEQSITQANEPPTPSLPDPQGNSSGYDLRLHLDEQEREAVTRALVANNNNQKRAAAFLQLSYDQLRGIIRKYGISVRKRSV